MNENVSMVSTRHKQNRCSIQKGKRRVQGVPQSQAAALPRHEEEEETDKTKQAHGVILYLCFSVLLALRLPPLAKRKLILVLFVRLFDLRLFDFVCFLFLLVSEKGCGSL